MSTANGQELILLKLIILRRKKGYDIGSGEDTSTIAQTYSCMLFLKRLEFYDVNRVAL